MDANDPDRIYFTSQNGGIGRRHLGSGERAMFRPRPEKGSKTRYRFNWHTPYLLSNHNSRIYYVAGNYVFRSLDRGNTLRRISPEITTTARGSATAFGESPKDPDLLYVGTDDGALHVTRDGGATWTDLFAEGAPLRELLPERPYVAWIEPSGAKAERAFVAFDAHRSDDDRPLVFVTEDAGKTWRSIVANLPDFGSTRVVREDPVNPDLLYLGTEFGAFASVDRGTSWTRLGANLPTVAVHAFAIHPTAGEIVAGTHGRSLWVLDVTALRQMKRPALTARAHLFAPQTAVQWRPRPGRGASRGFVGQNPYPGALLYVGITKKTSAVSLRIRAQSGKVLRELAVEGTPGLHRIAWDLREAPEKGRRRGRRVRPGTYVAELVVEGEKQTRPLEVRTDPGSPEPGWIAHADAAEALEDESDAEEASDGLGGFEAGD